MERGREKRREKEEEREGKKEGEGPDSHSKEGICLALTHYLLSYSPADGSVS